jgi:hypothetical protein
MRITVARISSPTTSIAVQPGLTFSGVSGTSAVATWSMSSCMVSA